MITIDNKVYRNLEEQVLKNKNDIEYLVNEQGVLNQFGIKVIGQVEYLNDLPTPEAYKESNPNWEYGDTYAVGLTSPYSLYILTRQNEENLTDYWFNIGQFPAPGPEGKAGEASDITVESTTTTLPGSLARVVNTGDKTHAKLQFYIPAGKKGDQGITPTVSIGTVSAGDYANVINSGSPTDVILDFVVPKGPKGDSIKGDPGDSFKIIGTLDNTNQLPTPSESIRSNAYLIADNTGRKHLWVITGDTTLLWTDAGAITGVPGQAATISVGGTVTLPANSQASVENAGTSSAAVLNFSIPKGKDGSSATVSIGSVSTLPAGSQATVTNIGTSKDAIFNFGIPKGDKGNTGDTAQSITITDQSTATSGTLTAEQLTTLQASNQNYIIFNNEIYRLEDKQFNNGFLIYSHTGQDNTKTMYIKEISVTISTRGWVLTKLAPQQKLVSGTNIKTLNNESLLGEGNIDITSAQWGNITGDLSNQTDLKNALDEKANNSTVESLTTQVSTNTTNISTNTTEINSLKTSLSTTNSNVTQNANNISTNASDIDDIEAKIPTQASSTNQLADKDFVNSSINNIAAFYITSNASGDAFETYAQLSTATVFYSGGQSRTPTRNDYCIVRSDENHNNATTRYIFQGSQWEFQYIVNDSPFTAAQLSAINSGITSSLVQQIGNNTTARHTHTNKAILDTITETLINSWNDKVNQTQLTAELNKKQDTLISGTNIKTINNNSILGSGNIAVSSKLYPNYSNRLYTNNPNL